MEKNKNIQIVGQNIGAFENFDLSLPSITLIAGENGTGKSTISKSLYMLLNVKNNVVSLLENEKNLLVGAIKQYEEVSKKFNLEKSNALSKNLLVLRNEIAHLKSINSSKSFDTIDSTLKNTIIKRLINAEFNNQAIKNKSEYGKLQLSAEDLSAAFFLSVNELQNSLSFKIQNNYNVIYLESSTFIDSVSVANKNYINHFNCTSRLLKNSIKDIDNYQESLFDEIDRNKMIDRFNDKIHDIIKGSFEYDKQTKAYFYKTENAKYSLDNVASGIKAFSSLDLLIKYGVVKNNSIIILDEPENNLHPLWQVNYAELLVSLVKDTDIRLIINSHSPFFIEAIELNCNKKLKNDDYKFYFTKREKDEISTVSDVTTDTSVIYDSLAAPYARLDKQWGEI